jgi:hypothetical protein
MVLYTLVVIFYDTLSSSRRDVINRINWKGKLKLTFSDMIRGVRSYLRLELIFEQILEERVFENYRRQLER